MPVSHWLPDGTTKKLLKRIKVNRFLDIGAGAGKYGKMVSFFHPDAEKIAVEIDETYVKDFELEKIYNQVWVMPAINLISEKIDESYDLVIIGDCFEHMRKSEGIDLLNFLVYRSKYILIHYPDRYIQETVDGHIHEAHISIWSEYDFYGFDYLLIKNGFIHTYAINGYLQNLSLINKITNTDPPIQKIFGTGKQRQVEINREKDLMEN